MPSKPDAKHAQQVAFYADVMGCKASLIYASKNGYRVFDETNCEELTPEGIQNGVGELRARAWSRENLMRLAPSSITLIQMLSPDWPDWSWKMAPQHRKRPEKCGALTLKIRRRVIHRKKCILRMVFTMFHRGVDFFPIVRPWGQSYSTRAFGERSNPLQGSGKERWP